jgi:biotin synthase
MHKSFLFKKNKQLTENNLIEKALSGIKFSKEEIAFLLLEANPEWVYEIANEIKKRVKFI